MINPLRPPDSAARHQSDPAQGKKKPGHLRPGKILRETRFA
jgi:hypothetical protein